MGAEEHLLQRHGVAPQPPFAMGMTRGDEVYHDEVCWSHPAEPNGIPFSWRPTIEQPDSIAGSVSLGRGGSIMGGESLRDSMVVYSEEAMNVFDFTGDALGWRRRTISTAAGLVGKEAVVEVDGVHYFIGPEDILAFDGNRVTSILHNKLRRRFAANLSGEHIGNSWAAHNKTFSEIWMGVPENGATNPNVAYVFNYRDGTFAIRDLEREINHAHFGDEPASVDIPWSSMSEVWDNERGAWTMGGDRPFEKVLYGVTDSVWDIDPSFGTVSSATEQTTPTIVTRTDLPIMGHEASTTITRVYPLVEGTSELEFRFGSQQKAGGPVRWAGGWRKFDPGVDRKIDVRTTGECHAFEVRSTGGFFNLTGLDIEFQPAGGR